MFSPNHVDYAVTIWAAHRIGAIISYAALLIHWRAGSLKHCSPANPSFSVNELVYQLNTTKANLLFTHSSVYNVALEAARVSGIPTDRIVLIDGTHPSDVTDKSLLTIEQLVNEGAKHSTGFTEKKLRSGEGKTKVAVS